MKPGVFGPINSNSENMEKKHSFKDWLLATRPWSFPASSMPVLVTMVYLYWQGFCVNWGIALWALVNVVVFHAAGNTWSDYYDFKRGVDREDTIGGLSIVSGLFKACEIKKLATWLLVVAIVSGIALVFFTGLPVLYFGLAACVLTILYPWFKFHALGDVDIFLTYSLLPVMGTSYVAVGFFETSVLWLVLPIGLITVGILHINNTRDIEQDKRAGIHTFAMLLGKRASVYLYILEMLLPFAWVGFAVYYGAFPLWAFVSFMALLPAIGNVRKALGFPANGMKALVGVDEATAQLQLLFSLLLSLSLFVDTLVR